MEERTLKTGSQSQGGGDDILGRLDVHFCLCVDDLKMIMESNYILFKN